MPNIEIRAIEAPPDQLPEILDYLGSVQILEQVITHRAQNDPDQHPNQSDADQIIVTVEGGEYPKEL